VLRAQRACAQARVQREREERGLKVREEVRNQDCPERSRENGGEGRQRRVRPARASRPW